MPFCSAQALFDFEVDLRLGLRLAEFYDKLIFCLFLCLLISENYRVFFDAVFFAFLGNWFL